MKIKFLGGFLDGEIREYTEPIPHRVELWPETDAQRERRIFTEKSCTSRDSQIYDQSINASGETVFHVVNPRRHF